MDEALAIAGRVAIVTGAGNGLGRAEALALARAGARLVLNDLPGDAVQAVADEIAADGGQAVAVAGDVAEWSTGEQLLATALGQYGRLDILVNNAGVLRDRMIFTMSPEEWDLVIRVHLRGHFVTTRLATAYWREQRKAAGHPVYARIVNTSSEAFLLGSAGQPNYAAAKAGIATLTVTTARSCSRYGVRANAICPRARTAMTAELMGPPPEGTVDPLAPEHVAPLVVYLASPAAEAINGEVFVVHGGVAAVMEPPRVRSVFRASGTPDGMWTLDSVAAALGPAFGSGTSGDRAPSVGFLCEDTLELTTETIGFPRGGAPSARGGAAARLARLGAWPGGQPAARPVWLARAAGVSMARDAVRRLDDTAKPRRRKGGRHEPELRIPAVPGRADQDARRCPGGRRAARPLGGGCPTRAPGSGAPGPGSGAPGPGSGA
jgi:NAD(P)-dependent dehydrogenase (short-subunit alcohol dehydrogenase family)